MNAPPGGETVIESHQLYFPLSKPAVLIHLAKTLSHQVNFLFITPHLSLRLCALARVNVSTRSVGYIYPLQTGCNLPPKFLHFLIIYKERFGVAPSSGHFWANKTITI